VIFKNSFNGTLCSNPALNWSHEIATHFSLFSVTSSIQSMAVLVYRCLHDMAPAYLSDVIRHVADISSRRRLRSSSTSALVVPAMRRSTVGDRAFHVAASRVWNRLPPHITSAPSLQTFKKGLKSFLFGRSFSSWSVWSVFLNCDFVTQA